ncbi:hypothetical protein CHS0354_012692 [Potamilus streckersoni]|uniref:Magnesium transporter NIPA2 n=1 Tax=Potamilus streckersoni TaxID=2493646 RepID=A0AAE0SXK0_9BIVA|nr:hypothetical protein CHS0354_012692 [Potamilus streckersoni]
MAGNNSFMVTAESSLINTTTESIELQNTTNASSFINTTKEVHKTNEGSVMNFYIGLVIAVLSSVMIGSSFIFKKVGLLRYAKKHDSRAGEGGHGYLKQWLWWAGMILMCFGEVANFAAYAFAPATLVTPLGALSVITSAVLSAKILKEHLNILGKIGCALCLLGATVVVVHSPKEPEVKSMEELLEKLKGPAFIAYGCFMVIVAVVFIIVIAPRYGQKNVLVYIIICSTLGSFTVPGCKGLGLAITETIGGRNQFVNWLTYVLFVVTAVCIVVQINFLNKALDTYNTAVVTPIYYVIFTTCAITGSLILFQEWGHMTFENILGGVCGFLVIVTAIFLMHAFKDLKISLSNLSRLIKQSQEEVSSALNGQVNEGFCDPDGVQLDSNENLQSIKEMNGDRKNISNGHVSIGFSVPGVQHDGNENLESGKEVNGDRNNISNGHVDVGFGVPGVDGFENLESRNEVNDDKYAILNGHISDGFCVPEDVHLDSIGNSESRKEYQNKPEQF